MINGLTFALKTTLAPQARFSTTNHLLDANSRFRAILLLACSSSPFHDLRFTGSVKGIATSFPVHWLQRFYNALISCYLRLAIPLSSFRVFIWGHYQSACAIS
ncbi:hypothetical protein D8B26_000527 [Coccidioides posadasii str. Silveira]|uniref:uncharacterized protein n=1 Tax=Coccidioides posadasii (strain RMSCC 757 / Silveira) TaxID=443226 RepID=UPI001BEF1C73|nr:hypothetical protein D8B26_000527 [Coccidioides posadasii str. Silveira]